MSKNGTDEQVAQILTGLTTIERNMDHPAATIDMFKASLANLAQLEAILLKVEVTDEQRNALADRLAAVKIKNRKKLNVLLPWPMVVFTNVPHCKNKVDLVNLLDHPVYWVRETAARALQFSVESLSKDSGAVQTLFQGLNALSETTDSDVRWHAIDLWLRVPAKAAEQAGLREQTLKWLETSLNDGQPEVCAAAIRGLLVYQPTEYTTRLKGILRETQHEAIREAARFALEKGEPDKKDEKCVVCGRIPPRELTYLFSSYTPHASDDYTMAGGASSPFINPACIPTPPRNPHDPSEWLTVQQQWRAEVIAMSRENRKGKPDWDPAWIVCAHCAKALGVQPEDMAKARAEAEKHLRGETAVGVLTEGGRRLKQQVESNCFVCSIVLDVSAPELEVFRAYRDLCLGLSLAGRTITRGYYALGPYLATFIARRPSLRSAVHGALLGLVPYARRAVEMRQGMRPQKKHP